MKKITIITILLCQMTISAQNWSFKSGGNAFDGKYRTSSIKGNGTDYPYNKPLLVINLFKEKSLNFYIANAGYFQDLSETEVLWIFTNEPNTLYKSNNLSKSDDSKIIFFDDFLNYNTKENLKQFEFIEKLKAASKVNIRIKDNYGQNDLVFSLRGSTKAINYVISKKFKQKLIAEQKQIENIAKKKLEEKTKVNARILKTLSPEEISEYSKKIFESIKQVFPDAAPYNRNFSGKVKVYSYAPILKKPNMVTSDIIGKAENNNVIILSKHNNGYYKVKSGKKIGYLWAGWFK